MSYFKLVNGTTTPTRYTKIINPGADTKYNRKYQPTEFVSRYTKTVSPPASWVPPAPPFEPLAVADGQGANWVGSNVYEVGKVVEARTAAYTGGKEPVTYRCRFQFRPAGQTEWQNGSWVATVNDKKPFLFAIEQEGDLKFQSQARDAQDPVVQLNSVTGTKTCKGIGDITATVNGSTYDFVAAPTITVESQSVNALTIQKSGDATVTYNWSVRGTTAAEFSNPTGASTDVTIVTAGVATVQCTIQSLGEVEKVDIQFFVV